MHSQLWQGACCWPVCSGKGHTCAPSRHKRSKANVFWGQCILQVWSQGVEELMMKSCESWIPEYQVAYLRCPAESLLAVFPCKTVQAVYIVNVMQRHRTGQVLCLWVLFSLGLFPGMHLQDNGGPLGWESMLGVCCLVMGTCLPSPLPTKERKRFFWHLMGEGAPKETGLSLSMNFYLPW